MKIRLDLQLHEVELTGEERVPELGELYLYGTHVHECDMRGRHHPRVIVRLKKEAEMARKTHYDLFPDLPPNPDSEGVAPELPMRVRYNT